MNDANHGPHQGLPNQEDFERNSRGLVPDAATLQGFQQTKGRPSQGTLWLQCYKRPSVDIAVLCYSEPWPLQGHQMFEGVLHGCLIS